jgi:uncharacterized protein (DUF58 family)
LTIMWGKRIGWALWLIAAALLYFFENNTGTRILLDAALILPPVSVLCAAAAAKSASVALTVPDTCKKGEKVRCILTLSGSRILWGASAICYVAAENQLTGERAGSSFIISGTGQSKKDYEFSSAHCGTLRLRTERTVIRDLFGLWSSKPLAVSEGYLTVYPDLFPLQVALAEQTAVTAEGEHRSMTRPGTDPSETFSIREYLPGDPIRQIHWKLSQKTDTTMLRELGLPVTEEVLLLLETSFRSLPDAVAVDETVSALLSVSRALALEGIIHLIGWKNRMLGEPELCEVRSEQDFEEMRDRILAASWGIDDESIGSCFMKWHAGSVYAHTAVFSPHGNTDVVSLYSGNRVTLLLPERTGAADAAIAAGGIYVTTISESLSYLEL